MPNLISHTEKQTVFESKKGCSKNFILILFSFITLSGMAIHLIYPDFNSMPWAPIKVTCWMMSFFIFIIAFVSSGTLNEQPGSYVFDHEKGWVAIHSIANPSVIGYVLYSEILKLDIHIESRKSKNSTTYYYHGYLEKRDGSKWHFVNSLKKDEVVKVIEDLLPCIKSDLPTSAPLQDELSNKIEKLGNKEQAVLHWQNKALFRTIQLIIFSIFYLGFISFCLLALFVFPETPAGAKIVVAIFLLFFGGLLGYALITAFRRNLKNLFRKFALSINATQLEYYEFNKLTGKQKKNVAFPLHAVGAIRYTYVSWENIKKPIEVIAKDENEKSVEIYIDALSPVECLQIENWLQQNIREKTGITDWNL
jgi:hypothetical protein